MCLAAFVRMNLASVGDCVVQFDGVPIGGFMSKIACSLILCVAETRWEENTPLLETHGFLPPGCRWSDVAACGRYVDDAAMVSAVLCKRCLQDALRLMYPVSFDVASEGRRIEWLDMVLDLDTCALDLLPKPFVTAPA